MVPKTLARTNAGRRGRRAVLVILALALLAGGGALTLAYAQSGGAAINLNSPVSFPVDI